MKKQQYPQLEESVKRSNPVVFVIVRRAGEMNAEGSKDIYSEKL